MIDLTRVHLDGKVLLEVGSGRGDTTRRLARLLAGRPGASLIVTDLSDDYFKPLGEEFRGLELPIRFVCTDALELEGISEASVDFLVCNYTLCAVEARTGETALALCRFGEVLKPGGWLLIEEEFPIDHVASFGQEIWAEKWRILKSAIILAGGFPYAEISPEILENLCRLTGFQVVEWQAETAWIEGPGALDFFQTRLDRLLTRLPAGSLLTGFTHMASSLRERAMQLGGMEIPYYRLQAQKAEG